jgi:O-antigen/teichoic acid export membrane protein
MTALRGAQRREAMLRPNDPMLRSGYSLIANVMITAVLGLGFWITAARLFPTSVVGRDTVLVSAMLSVSAFCQLNLSSVILRFLRIARVSPGRFVVGSYVVVGTLSLLVASAFVIAAPHVSHSFAFFHREPWLLPVFVVAVAVWGIFALQDAVLTAFRRTAWVPIENALFGVLKLALLPVLLLAGAAHAMFLAWMLAMAVLIVPINSLIFRSVIPNRPPRGDVPSPVERFGWGGLIRFSLRDLGGTLFGLGASTMLPVVVVAFVGTTQSAFFYMPFTLIATFDLMFLNVAAALTVEGGASEQRLAELVRLTARRYAPLLLGSIVLILVSAPLLLSLYGSSYAQAGTPVLRLLACASIFRAATALCIGVSRVQGRGGWILAAQGATFALVIGLTAVLAPGHGIDGVAIAWLVANGLVGIVAMQRLIRMLWRQRTTDDAVDRSRNGSPAMADSRFLCVTVTESIPKAATNLEHLVASLDRQGVDIDLVIVVRGGVDNEPGYARGRVRLHRLNAPRATALSVARNLALAHARETGLLDKADIVAFPDDDCRYGDGLLTRVASQLAESGCEAVTGAYGPSAGTVDRRRFRFGDASLTPTLIMRVGCSAAMFMTGNAVRAVGDWDVRFGLGAMYGASEDADYALRFLALGFTGAYRPAGIVVEHPYKANRPAEYYLGNVAVLAKHARGRVAIKLLLARRLAGGVALVLRSRMSLARFGQAVHAARAPWPEC